MEILTVMEKLNEVYKRGNPSLGCFSRANILHQIMKSKGLDSKRAHFVIKNKKGVVVHPTHCVVIHANKVYDANLEPIANPVLIQSYETMKKEGNTESVFEWG